MTNFKALTVYKPKGKELALHEFAQFTVTLGNNPNAQNITTFALTGATSGVGTTTVSENLARSLSMGGERVLLVCIEPSKQGEDRPLPLGSVETLLAKAQKGQDDYFQVGIPANSLPQVSPKSDNGLGAIMKEIGSRFAYVIWDVPPVDIAAQSRVICQNAQGVILVVHAGKTRWHSARHTINTLEQAGARMLGVVLNKKKNYIPQWIYRMFFRYQI